MDRPFLSIVIPAFNEESYLGPTLDCVYASIAHAKLADERAVEVIVVDNASTDQTADIARSHGAVVVDEPRGNVAIARNAGARAATGEVLVFVDADVLWPPEVVSRIIKTMSHEKCLGGAVDTEYRPRSSLVNAYLHMWRVIGRFCKMAQGATQFCKADTFEELGGYNEQVFMGEDVDFYWRLRNVARAKQGVVCLVDDVRVVPSCRKFDQWPLWKTVLLTNPLTCLLFSRRKRPWGDWYESPVR